jgi:hypothetical protein
MAALVISLLTILTGCAGTKVSESRRCACCFGLTTFITAITLAVVSVVIVSIYAISTEDINNFCDDDYAYESSPFETQLMQLRSAINVLDDGNEALVSEHMCTDMCPCPPDVDFTKWSEVRQKRFAKPRAQGGEYNFKGTYTSFKSCYDDKKSLFILGAGGKKNLPTEA